MKKRFLVLPIIFGIFSFADKKLNIVYKAEIRNEGRFSKIENSNIEYVPLNLTVSSLNNEYKANLIIKGGRKNLNYSDLVTRYVTGLRENNPVIMKNGYIQYQQYNDRRTPDYNQLESSIFSDNQQGGHDHHHHHHHHDHDHDHDHEHNHTDLIGESLDIQAPQQKHNVRESNDFQAKISLEVNKKKYGLKYIKYLTSFNEEEFRYRKHDSIFEGRITQIINDNIAISLIPRVITREFTPSILEVNSYLKYRLNKDAFIGIEMYNGGQINLLDERKIYRNKFTGYFDYNTERRRVHDFWEILDHEHDKIDQFKVSLSYDRKYNAKYSPLNSHILDGYNDNEKYDLKLNLKKSDFGIKGLSLSNNFVFNTEFNQRVNSDRKYKLKHYYYFNQSDNKTIDNFYTVFDRARRNVIVNIANQTTLGTSIHKINGKYLITNHYRYAPNGKDPFEYYVVTEVISEGPNRFSNVITKKYNIDNVSKIEYVRGKNKVKAVNDIKYVNDVYNGNSKLNENFLLSYERNLKLGFRAKFDLENKYEMSDLNNKKLYENDVLNGGFDFNYIYNQNGLNVKTGLIFNAALLARKADKSMLLGPSIPEKIKKELHENTGYLTQEQNEANKWVLGEEFKIKPYISLKYLYDSKFGIKANFEVEKIFFKTPFEKLYFRYNPADKKIRSKPFSYKLGIEINYRY